MNRPAVISPVLLITLVAAVLGVMLIVFYIQLRDKSEAYVADELGPGSFSHSALGYAGLAGILERLSIPTIKSKEGSAAKTEGGLLIVAEPNSHPQNEAALGDMLKAEKVLLVLPKWTGLPQFFRSGWISSAHERSLYDVQSVLKKVSEKGEAVRLPASPAWTMNLFKQAPQLDAPAQLIKGSDMKPLIGSADGILLGEITKGTQRIWVLADPDVLANHGLGKEGDKNAVLAVELINYMRGVRGKVVFDEAVHGHVRPAAAPSAARLLEFPYTVLGALGFVAVILLLWATLGRFGKPELAPPPLAAGKEGLVDNVARLMEFAGHERAMVHRYAEATIRDVARQLHAPKGLSAQELAAWLERVGEARGVAPGCNELIRRAKDLPRGGQTSLAAFASVARDIYRWKQEITHGPSRRTRDN